MAAEDEKAATSPKGQTETVQDPPADWMEKLPPDVRAKVHAVLYEGWPTEDDLMTVEGQPNQTQVDTLN
jgi:hypothetical protein